MVIAFTWSRSIIVLKIALNKKTQQAWILIQIKNFIDSDDEGRVYPLQNIAFFEIDLLSLVDTMED